MKLQVIQAQEAMDDCVRDLLADFWCDRSDER